LNEFTRQQEQQQQYEQQRQRHDNDNIIVNLLNTGRK